MLEKLIKVKITPEQARYVIQLLNEALKDSKGKKIALVITDLDIQVETVSEFLDEPEEDRTTDHKCEYKRERL
jgi:hypothetical protein